MPRYIEEQTLPPTGEQLLSDLASLGLREIPAAPQPTEPSQEEERIARMYTGRVVRVAPASGSVALVRYALTNPVLDKRPRDPEMGGRTPWAVVARPVKGVITRIFTDGSFRLEGPLPKILKEMDLARPIRVHPFNEQGNPQVDITFV